MNAFASYLDCYAVGISAVTTAVDDAYARTHSLTFYCRIYAPVVLLFLGCMYSLCGSSRSINLSLPLSLSIANIPAKKIDKNLPCTYFPLSGSQKLDSQFIVRFMLCPLSLAHSLSTFTVCVCVFLCYKLLHLALFYLLVKPASVS